MNTQKSENFIIGNLSFSTEKGRERFIKKYSQVICRSGYVTSDIDKEVVLLTSKFNKQASFADAIWSLFNKKALDIGKTTPIDFQLLSNLYFDMSMFLAESGNNPSPALEEVHKFKLLYLKQHFSKVRISCQSLGCKNCQKLSEKIFTIDEALKNKPLPNSRCSSIKFKTGKFPWCTCYYVAVV